jgi:hypothetical protein
MGPGLFRRLAIRRCSTSTDWSSVSFHNVAAPNSLWRFAVLVDLGPNVILSLGSWYMGDLCMALGCQRGIIKY